MESDAKGYSALNKPQYDMGCDLVRFLNISEGDKVLDMGCGTGELTNFIANLVGPHGEVVAIDPDEARIKIAREKFKDVQNVHFLVGDSSSKLPHDEEEYYDLYFSSNVFHWLIGNDKKVYLEKAYQCLKPGGRLALLTGVKHDLFPGIDLPIETLTGAEYKQMCEDSSFKNVVTETLPLISRFSNVEEFHGWFRATCHRDLMEFDPDWIKLFFEKATKTETDGSIIMKVDGSIRIIAEKRGL